MDPRIMSLFGVPAGMGMPGGAPPAPLTPPMVRPAQMPMGTGPLTSGPGMAPTANPNMPGFMGPPMMNPGLGGSAHGVSGDPTAAIAQFLGATGARPPGSPGAGMTPRPAGEPMSLAPPSPGPSTAPGSATKTPMGQAGAGVMEALKGVGKVTPPETRVPAAPGGGASGNYNAPDLNTLLRLFVSGAPQMAQIPSLGQLLGR